VALRQRLQCKPFKYFMDLFFKDKFIPTPDNIKHMGQIRAGTGQCVDKLGGQVRHAVARSGQP
jgi:hypothetical protein